MQAMTSHVGSFEPARSTKKILNFFAGSSISRLDGAILAKIIRELRRKHIENEISVFSGHIGALLFVRSMSDAVLPPPKFWTYAQCLMGFGMNNAILK
jgi:hypothetical protein